MSASDIASPVLQGEKEGNAASYDRRRVDVRPHLVIPYWAQSTGGQTQSDDGTMRPVPAGIVGYLCPAIHASAYEPGKDLTVSVDVSNFGDGNSASLARVTVWWSDPTTGFVLDPAQLIGQTVVPVRPRGGRSTSPPITARIPPSAPIHACLIARVSHPLDPAGTVPLPAADRHWAQRNLVAVSSQQGVPVIFTLLAGNPFLEASDFKLIASVMSEEEHSSLAREIGLMPHRADARVSLRADRDARESPELSVTLRPKEKVPVSVTVYVGGTGPRRGEFLGVRILQHGHQGEAGGLGIIIRG